MRNTCLALTALCLLGCVDSDRARTAVNPNSPAATPRVDTARPTTTTADNTSRTADTAQGESRTVLRPTEPDNTGVNARDADRTARQPKLPFDQKENQPDIDVTAKIRSRVVGTDGMSINARNIKIITADGKVTLRGPVESASERDRIATIAREVAGDGNVDDQIEVKGATTTAPATTNPATTSPPTTSPSTTNP